MLKLYFLLCYEFMKIGLFAIGGGYATLPFLYFLQSQYNWFTVEELTNMIAVSNITPGAVGINMATYTGYTTAGIIGALICTISIIFIPFIITILIAKLFTKFQNNKTVNDIFVGLRPASCALLASIGIKLLYQTVVKQTEQNIFQFDFHSLIIFLILFIPFIFMKKNPIIIILIGAIAGIIIKPF